MEEKARSKLRILKGLPENLVICSGSHLRQVGEVRVIVAKPHVELQSRKLEIKSYTSREKRLCLTKRDWEKSLNFNVNMRGKDVQRYYSIAHRFKFWMVRRWGLAGKAAHGEIC